MIYVLAHLSWAKLLLSHPIYKDVLKELNNSIPWTPIQQKTVEVHSRSRAPKSSLSIHLVPTVPHTHRTNLFLFHFISLCLNP